MLVMRWWYMGGSNRERVFLSEKARLYINKNQSRNKQNQFQVWATEGLHRFSLFAFRLIRHWLLCATPQSHVMRNVKVYHSRIVFLSISIIDDFSAMPVRHQQHSGTPKMNKQTEETCYQNACGIKTRTVTNKFGYWRAHFYISVYLCQNLQNIFSLVFTIYPVQILIMY